MTPAKGTCLKALCHPCLLGCDVSVGVEGDGGGGIVVLVVLQRAV